MSNFSEIFFDLLITVMMSQYGFSQTLVATIGEMSEVTNPPSPIYYRSLFYRYGKENRFFFHYTDPESELSYKLGGEFSSKAIEFCSFHNNEVEFYFRQSASQVVIRVKCSFSQEDFIQRFFDSIYRLQNKGTVAHVFKMALYNKETKEVRLFVEQATFYVKDTYIFTNGAIAKTYSISHYSHTSELLEPLLIFHSGAFAISEITHGEKIAVCLRDFPNERFLIAFSGPRPCKMLVRRHMQPDMRVSGMECEFPDISNLPQYGILDAR